MAVGKDFVELSWPRPRSDGGARVQGYRVEQRPTHGAKWEPAKLEEEAVTAVKATPKESAAQELTEAEKPQEELCAGTSCRVRGLPTEEQMMFRVVPVNNIGPGEPSPASQAVTIQEKLGILYEFAFF